MTIQLRYTIRCLLWLKHDTHKLLTIFNVLPNLISLLLTACDGTQLEDTNKLVLYHDVFSSGARSLLVFSFTLRPLYLQYPPNSSAGKSQSV